MHQHYFSTITKSIDNDARPRNNDLIIIKIVMMIIVIVTDVNERRLALSDLQLALRQSAAPSSSCFGWHADDLPLCRHVIEDCSRAKLRQTLRSSMMVL